MRLKSEHKNKNSKLGKQLLASPLKSGKRAKPRLESAGNPQNDEMQVAEKSRLQKNVRLKIERNRLESALDTNKASTQLQLTLKKAKNNQRRKNRRHREKARRALNPEIANLLFRRKARDRRDESARPSETPKMKSKLRVLPRSSAVIRTKTN